MLFQTLFCMLVGFGIGSLPTALIFARLRGVESLEAAPTLDDQSVQQTVSALWQRTNLEWLRVMVGVIDAAKGFIAVLAGALLMQGMFVGPALAGFFALLGHNYNPFLKARHGRGMPVMAGVMAAINPFAVLVFVICWLTGFLVIRRNYYVGLLTATFATPILLYTAPDLLIQTFMRVPLQTIMQFRIFTVLLAVQVFVRHLEPMRAVFNDENEES